MASPVEALRSAAVLLRRLAANATTGKWGLNEYGDAVWVAGEWVADTNLGDAQYMVAMQPSRALFLVDALDRIAQFDPIEDHPLVGLARVLLLDAVPAAAAEPVGRPVETVHLPVLGDSP